MPVPKRKTSKSRRDMRQACKFIRPKAFVKCATAECEAPLMPHQACTDCGYYKGKKVLATKAERAGKRTKVRQELAAKQAAREATTTDAGNKQA